MRKVVFTSAQAALLLWLVTLVQLVAEARTQAARADETVGIPWTGAVGVRERNSDIMEREPRGRQVGRVLRVHKHGHIEFALYIDPSQLPPEEPVTSGPEASAKAQTVALNFLGATLADTLAYPPDSMGAVGPSQYIVVGAPNLSASRTFTAAIMPRPLIQSIAFSNAFVVLTWNSISGQTYRVQTKLNLDVTDWSNLLPDMTATGPSASRVTLPVSPSQQYYRLLVLP